MDIGGPEPRPDGSSDPLSAESPDRTPTAAAAARRTMASDPLLLLPASPSSSQSLSAADAGRKRKAECSEHPAPRPPPAAPAPAAAAASPQAGGGPFPAADATAATPPAAFPPLAAAAAVATAEAPAPAPAASSHAFAFSVSSSPRDLAGADTGASRPLQQARAPASAPSAAASSSSAHSLPPPPPSPQQQGLHRIDTISHQSITLDDEDESDDDDDVHIVPTPAPTRLSATALPTPPASVSTSAAPASHPPPPPLQQASRSTESAATTLSAAASSNMADVDDDDDDDDDGATCIICFDSWSNAGPHQVCSLKCGHLFGKSCIEKWLRGRGERCPQCNAVAKRQEIRVIYVKNLKVQDTSERDMALKEAKQLRAERDKARRSEAKAILEFQLLKTEHERLQRQLEELRSQARAGPSVPLSQASAASPSWEASAADRLPPPSAAPDTASSSSAVPAASCSFKFLTSVQLGQNPAKVLEHTPHSDMLIASGELRRASPIFRPGTGIIKISTLDFGHTEYVGIHEKPLRDIRCAPDGELLLSVAMDKKVALTSLTTNSVVQMFRVEGGESWSCAWDQAKPTQFYCGLTNNSILVYDTRQTRTHLACIRGPRQMPIASLQHMDAGSYGAEALAVGTVNGLYLWPRSPDETAMFEPAAEPVLSGYCASIALHAPARSLMASFRPSTLFPAGRHVVAAFHGAREEGGDGDGDGGGHDGGIEGNSLPSLTPLQQFEGCSSSRILSRTTLGCLPGTEQLLAFAGDEAREQIRVWDVSDGRERQRLTVPRPPAPARRNGNGSSSSSSSSSQATPSLALKTFQHNGEHYLASLSAARLSVFKWQQA